jgi:hypothetical protein
MLEIAESSNPGVEICCVIGQILWCTVSCAQIISFVILTPGIGTMINGAPSQLGAETFLSRRTSPVERYARILSVEPLRMRVWRVSKALKTTYWGRQRPSWCGVTGHNLRARHSQSHWVP